ncbi:MAG: thiolase family protein [Pseudomonadota bacterium]
MREVAILSSVRTAGAKANKGGFRDTRPDTLAAAVIKGALDKAKVEAKDLDDVILGCAFPEAEQGMNVARVAAGMAGVPWEVPAMTINRFCSSGLQAIAIGADRIRVGDCEVVVAGGVESMSMVPMGGNKYSLNADALEKMPNMYTPMGITSELVATRFEITREQQDELALRSNLRAAAAVKDGKFKDEIIPVTTKVYEAGGVKSITVDNDEGPRGETTLESLAKLKPAFDSQGRSTAGNSSQVTDGAAVSVLMDAERAKKEGRDILGYFRGFAVAGVPPEIMGIGPVPAIRKLLKKMKLEIKDIDLFEINEAFASQATYCARELGIDSEKLNVNGGAIALGHPLGATGAKLTATLLHEMKRRKARYGIVSMCIGGGMGAAGLFERA